MGTMKSPEKMNITVSLSSFTRELSRLLLLAPVLLFLVPPGCRSSPEEDAGVLEKQPAGIGEEKGPGKVAQDRGLPGPPGTARNPSATDPEERKLEERLFKTDGGRIVLKGIRAHGGWQQWLQVKKIDSVLEEIHPQAEDPGSPPPDTGYPEPGHPDTERTDPELLGASLPGGLVVGPFFFAKPSFRLEYLGVEIDSGTGETYDKVQVFQEVPSTEWIIAYFNRYKGTLDRVLYPRVLQGGVQQGFTRVDLRDHRRVKGILFPTQWITFFLPDRYSRADLSLPERVEKLEITVDLKGEEDPEQTPVEP